jgi:hypothetical protein
MIREDHLWKKEAEKFLLRCTRWNYADKDRWTGIVFSDEYTKRLQYSIQQKWILSSQ